MAAPSSDSASDFSRARRTESTRLICPAPMPAVARSLASTIALERTCLQTFQAKSISPHSASVGLRSVTTCISERSSMSRSRSCTSMPPMTCFISGSTRFDRPLLVVLEDAQVLLLAEDLQRVVVELRREEHLDELARQLLGQRAVDRPVQRHHAAERAHADRRRRPRGRPPAPSPRARTPHGLLCLTITQAGISNSRAAARAALRSSRLLKESSLPLSWRTIERTCMRAPDLASRRRPAGGGSRRRAGR